MPKKTKMDLIEPLVDAINMHKLQYDSGDTDYSVTTLLNPPRVVHLNKRHLSDTTTFVFENLQSFTGTGVHDRFEALLPQVPNKLYIVEQRLFDVVRDRKVSGCFDILSLEHLYDIKTCNTWKYIKGDFSDWAAQQNMYRLLYWKKYKIEITALSIIAIFKDWSKYRMMQAKDYPRLPAEQIDLPVWDFPQIQSYMNERVELMIDNETVADDDLPYCSHDEFWGDDDTYAVKRKDRKRALRVLDTMPEAKKWTGQYIFNNPGKPGINVSNIFIESRLGRRKRCLDWCPVNDHCKQFHEYMKEINPKHDKSYR